MHKLFPEIEPFKTYHLQVSSLHSTYVEECGNPTGQPVLFLHGGPGAGLSKVHRRFFDPSHYRIILFDQRGAGQSIPFASLQDNTTWHLCDDIETLRRHLSIASWLVFGGSWGSTLALAYAEKFPKSVAGLILRGIFLGRHEELQFFYQKGADLIFTDLFENYVRPIPLNERTDLIGAFYKRLTHEDPAIVLEAAKASATWEASTIKLIPDPNVIEIFSSDKNATSLARIECHYFVNNCFFPEDNHLINNAHRIQSIPGVIVHGRYDIVCPFKNALDLHRAWPSARFVVVPDAGHSVEEPGILNELIQATEDFKGISK